MADRGVLEVVRRGVDGFLLQGPARGRGLHHLHGYRQARERGAHQVRVPGGYLVISPPCVPQGLFPSFQEVGVAY